jgi:serine/threonine-protein kinase
VLLFQLMTGKVPFDSSTAFGTALMHVTDEPTRPRLLNPRVDSRLEKICLKAMRKRPDERHASARELRAELRALLGHDDAYADESKLDDVLPQGSLLAQIESRPRRMGLVMAGVVAVATVGAFTYLYPQRSAAHSPNAERVQTATIASAVVPSSRAVPPPTATVEAPSRIVDTTLAGTPGADATSVVAPIARPRGAGVPKANARRATGKSRNATPAADVPIGVLEETAPSAAPAPPAKKAEPVEPPLPVFPVPSSDAPAPPPAKAPPAAPPQEPTPPPTAP